MEQAKVDANSRLKLSCDWNDELNIEYDIFQKHGCLEGNLL